MSGSASMIAVIGAPDTVAPFKFLGCSEFAVNTVNEAELTLKLVESQGFYIVFIEETFAAQCMPAIEEISKSNKLTSITIIPGSRGSKGLARRQLSELTRKAVGMDMLAHN